MVLVRSKFKVTGQSSSEIFATKNKVYFSPKINTIARTENKKSHSGPLDRTMRQFLSSTALVIMLL